MSDSIVARKLLSAFWGAAPTPAISASAVASQSEISRWSAQVWSRARVVSPMPRLGRVAGGGGLRGAASGSVRDAEKGHGVVRVVEHLEVGDEVLDLGALVEARA